MLETDYRSFLRVPSSGKFGCTCSCYESHTIWPFCCFLLFCVWYFFCLFALLLFCCFVVLLFCCFVVFVTSFCFVFVVVFLFFCCFLFLFHCLFFLYFCLDLQFTFPLVDPTRSDNLSF